MQPPMWKCSICGLTNYYRKLPCLCGNCEPAMPQGKNMTNITITPEYWAQPDTIKYHYKRPDGTLWNVSRVENDLASVWTINAWGCVYNEACPVSQLTPIQHETNVEAFDRIRKERA